MPKTGPNTAGGRAMRASALVLLLALASGGIASIACIGSCANQPYYESQAAARTAYEAAESARRAADAAAVAAIELRLSNDRLGESADKLRNVITGEGFARRVPIHDDGVSHAGDTKNSSPPTSQPPANAESSASTPKTSANDDPHGVLPALAGSTKATTEGAVATNALASQQQELAKSQQDLTKAQQELARSQQELTDATKSLSTAVKGMRPTPENVAPSPETPDEGSDRVPQADMFDMDLAFGATAFLSLVAIAWWSSDARARAKADNRADWLAVSSAACAAMVSIALAGVVYFGIRAYRDGPTPGPHYGIPWFVMAWVWCGMVGVGILVMWIAALAGFWHRVGATAADVAAARANDRPDTWRLWMIILAIGALPASGLLVEGRFFLLLCLLLVVVFAIFAGMAMLATARDEAVLIAKKNL